MGCWISPCSGLLQVGVRFETCEQFISLIFHFFFIRGKPRITETADTESVDTVTWLYIGIDMEWLNSQYRFGYQVYQLDFDQHIIRNNPRILQLCWTDRFLVLSKIVPMWLSQNTDDQHSASVSVSGLLFMQAGPVLLHLPRTKLHSAWYCTYCWDVHCTFWTVSPCVLGKILWLFGGTCYFYFEGIRVKMEAWSF
jgi:hypothetical protein